MRAVAYTALAGLVAIFAFAGPKPASALPAAAALNHSQPQASDVVQVGKRYRRGYRYRRPYYRGNRYRRPYYRGYGYRRPYYRRPYYRPYYNRRPYYRPYYRPYRRPGISIWIG